MSAQPAPWGPTLTPVTGVFGSVCLGRGRHFYGGQANFETTALTAALPTGTPIVGLFANGALHDGVIRTNFDQHAVCNDLFLSRQTFAL